jgi:four helix bundle protein
MRDFKQVKVWQKGQQLALDVYAATATFPREEMYGLTSQLRRAASSIPANIAEGCGRNTVPDLARFIQNSMGSASELESHLLLSHDLGYLTQPAFAGLERLTVEEKKMLSSFLVRLRADDR